MHVSYISNGFVVLFWAKDFGAKTQEMQYQRALWVNRLLKDVRDAMVEIHRYRNINWQYLLWEILYYAHLFSIILHYS